MSEIRAVGDDVRAIAIPEHPEPAWAGRTAQRLREAHGWSDEVPVQDLLEAVSGEPGAGSWLVLVAPERPAFCTMRVLLLDEAISEDRQRELLDPPAYLPPARRRVTIDALGRGTRAAVVQQDSELGLQSTVRWVFARPRHAIVALVGPTAPDTATAVLPVAEAVLGALEVKSDGEAFARAEDASIVLDDPAVEAWDL